MAASRSDLTSGRNTGSRQANPTAICPLYLRKRPDWCVASNGREVPILLQKSLMPSANSDSVALMRFAAEAGDDGGGSITTKGSCFIRFLLKRLFPTIT